MYYDKKCVLINVTFFAKRCQIFYCSIFLSIPFFLMLFYDCIPSFEMFAETCMPSNGNFVHPHSKCNIDI